MQSVLDAGLVLGLGGLLVSGRLSTARCFALFIVAVLATGRISFDDAIDRLVTPAIIAVTSLVVIAGALTRLPGLPQLFFGRRQRSLRTTLARFLGLTAATSAVTPNTAVVAALLGPAARRPNMDPRSLLLPLSYMALAGGMLTPFGTSASLMVTGEAARHEVTLGVLDFALPGLAVVLAVFATLVLAAPILLKPRQDSSEASADIFHVEARLAPDSPLIGKAVSTNRLRHLHSFFLAEVAQRLHGAEACGLEQQFDLVLAVPAQTRGLDLAVGDFPVRVEHLEAVLDFHELLAAVELVARVAKRAPAVFQDPVLLQTPNAIERLVGDFVPRGEQRKNQQAVWLQVRFRFGQCRESIFAIVQ